jgi:triacylglycerol lipase
VLLVHGYGCSRAAWWWLRRRLQAAGWMVATINLEPIYCSIDDFTAPLARRIDAVLAETGAERLILVGHSMGGLVARAYLQRHGEARVAGLVTLGTPHQGSGLAHLGYGLNARQMRPGSPWLEALAKPGPGLATVVIYSPHDNFVMPQANLRLPAAVDRPLDGIGHLAMLFSPRVADTLLAVLAPIADISKRASSA